MKRPILVITIGYIIGILGANLHFILLPIIFLYPLIILILKIKKLYIRFYLKKSIILIFIISTIISNTITLILNYKYDNLYSNINEGELEATVVSRKTEKEYKNVYKVKVNKINNNKKFKNTYLLLYTKKNINLNYGDLIKTNIIYEKPSIQRNYKGFNYKEYLKTIKVYGLATAEKNVKIIKSKNINYIYYYCNALNENLQENINKHFSKETASVLIGMVLGEKQFIEEDITQSFKKSSLSHILAISGAHVNYVIVLISFIVSKTKIANRKGKIISIIFLLFFMVLTGMQISVIRAVISSCLIIIASLLYRQFDTINSVCFSMLIILLLNPFNINSLSLQLSFGGTLGIILFLEFLYKRNENKIIDYIKNAIFVSVSAQIIIFPIMLKNFGTVSFTFFISNLLVSPLLGIIIVLGILFCFISLFSNVLSNSICFILNPMLKLLIFISKFSSQIPFSQKYIIIPSILFFIIYYLILGYFIRFKSLSKLRKRRIINIIKDLKSKIISICLILVLIISVIKIIPKDLKIYFIDVGQR